ncbi:MAG: IS1380 family transposase [bacterium]
MALKDKNVKHKIDRIGTTTDCLASRAGLSLISKYITSTRISTILSDVFSFLRKSSKGTRLSSLFHQLICFFFDGTNHHLTHFDNLVKDKGYAASIETPLYQMASSHAMKRFFQAFSVVRVWLFRKIIQRLFLWRLSIEKPEVIIIGLDTMVMDNDEAKKREGVEPTYKKVKGFQPLQMYWGRYIIDTIFRNGKAHSNHGTHVKQMVTNVVKLIRNHYSATVPIILVADTGFFSEETFKLCNQLGIGFIIGGKMYNDIKELISGKPENEFFEYTRKGKTWFFCEFMDQRKKWETSWRTIYTKPISDDDGQILLEFERPETIIYTNLGMNNSITQTVLKVKGTQETTISPQAIITGYHKRGCDELINRGLKDFGTEILPFKRFTANAAYYYMMIISFFLFESFKYDIDCEIIPLSWYATTFRRRCIDIAGKIVKTGRQLILKIAESTYHLLQFDILFSRSVSPFPIQ